MRSKKILLVLTSTHELGNSGHHTGAYLSEITHPYEEFVHAGYEVDMISPLGGKAPLDGIRMDDPINATWMNDEEFLEKIEHTLRPWQVNGKDYNAIYFAGGHGAMFDFPDNLNLQKIVTDIFENNGVVGAVCHGGAGLVNVRLSDGRFLVRDHEVACFTNAEEKSVGLESIVPFLLQTRLEERGAKVTTAPNFAGCVVKSGRLVTGQNPASAAGVGQGIVEVLDFINEGKNIPEQNWCEWHEPSTHAERWVNRM